MNNHEDVIIVGSGLGGLICGAILSKEGYIVTILEKNIQIGGNLQSYARDKTAFDSGVHYIGSLGKGQNLYKIFNYLGLIDKLKLVRMNEDGYDKILFLNDPKEYCYAQGYDKFIATLVKDFPEEKEGILKYCETIKNVCSKFPMYNLRTGNPFEKSEYMAMDTRDFIVSCTKNLKLQNVLGGVNILYSGIADKTPLYVHALVLNSYIESSWKLVDGSAQLAREIARIIIQNGGKIIKRAEVIKFQVVENKVDYVETKNGTRYYGKYFISNIHPATTLEYTETPVIKKVFRNRIKRLENSLSAFIVNIVLKPDTFPYQNSNYYFYLNEDVWSVMNYTEDNWPLGVAVYFTPSIEGSVYAKGVTLLSYMLMRDVEKWKDTFNSTLFPSSRNQEYQEFKRIKTERLISCAELKFPGLRNSIKTYYTATPLTIRDYIGSPDGSMYGIAKDYKNPMLTLISSRTKVNNLFLTGQNLNMHGILGVSISSLITSSEIINLESLLEKINSA